MLIARSIEIRNIQLCNLDLFHETQKIGELTS